MNLPSFWVYVLYSLRDHKFYIGSTNNLQRRMYQHESGQNISTRLRRPLLLLYCEGHQSVIDARRRELYFKTTKGRVTLKYVLRNQLDYMTKKQ